MTPEREQLIRASWKAHASGWDPAKLPRLKAPLRAKPDISPVSWGRSFDTPIVYDTIEFSIEYGTYEGRRAGRVVCEGIVLDQWFER